MRKRYREERESGVEIDEMGWGWGEYTKGRETEKEKARGGEEIIAFNIHSLMRSPYSKYDYDMNLCFCLQFYDYYFHVFFGFLR